MVANLAWSVCLSLSTVFAWLGRTGTLKAAYISVCTLQLLAFVPCLLGYLSINAPASAIGIGLSIPQVAYRIVVVAWFEHRIVDLYLLGGTVWSLVEAVVYQVCIGQYHYSEGIQATFLGPALVLPFLWLIFRTVRALVIRHACQLVIQDRAKYDRVWASVLGDAAAAACTSGALLEVARVAGELAAACEPDEARQMVPTKADESGAERGQVFGQPWSRGIMILRAVAKQVYWNPTDASSNIDAELGNINVELGSAALAPQSYGGRPIASLDQLYVQVVQICI